MPAEMPSEDFQPRPPTGHAGMGGRAPHALAVPGRAVASRGAAIDTAALPLPPGPAGAMERAWAWRVPRFEVFKRERFLKVCRMKAAASTPRRNSAEILPGMIVARA